jgi:hypothetical protein
VLDFDPITKLVREVSVPPALTSRR